ncbi:hypothetical protein Tco_1211379 [Tanacetum coccineum]
MWAVLGRKNECKSIHVISVVPAEVPIALADPLVAPEVGAVSVISPTGVLLVDYSSSSDSDPLEDSLRVAPELLLVSPFLCSDDSEADSESEPAKQRLERHESLTPSSEFLLAPIVAPPGIRRRLAILVRPGSSSDSLSDSSSVHSSGQSHLGPLTRAASPRLVDPPVRTPRCSEVFMRWRSLDSSSPSAGPSRKRCRSPATLVPSSTPVSRSIVLALADLPPRKRFRDSYSSEVSGEEHMEIGTADAETVADLGISEEVGAHTEDGIYLGVEVATSDIREVEEEFEAEASAGGTMEIAVDPLATGDIFVPTRGDAPDLEGTLYDISHYMSKVPLDRIIEFETAQRQLKAGQLEASRERERAGLADRVRILGRENLRVQALLCIERDHVDSLRRHMALSQEEFCQVRRDCDDTQRRLRRLESLVERRLGFRPLLRYEKLILILSRIRLYCYLLVLEKHFLLTMNNTRSRMTSAAIEEMINRRVTKALETREANMNIGLGNGNDEDGNGNGNGNGNGGENGNGNHNENDTDARPIV